MTLRELSKPQWDAALIAARCLTQGNPNRPADCAAFREALAAVAALLPPDADAKDIVGQAVRWDALNSIAAAFAGLPEGVVIQ